MIIWMNRIARHLKKEIEEKVESYASRAGSAAGWGLGLFVFLMVVREGAELALILRAVELSTEGLQTWIGTIAGIGAAVAVGLFFFKGTLKVPLHRFFAVTSWILMLVAAKNRCRGTLSVPLKKKSPTATAAGLFFFKGTLKVPLHRFFAVTSWILMLVAVQLAVTGLHELSEAQWLPSSKTEMAVLGPIVANELFFFVFVVGAAALMIVLAW